MGTLGCINDMLQRDKENRELRKLNRDRIKEHQKYLVNKGKGNDLSNISIEQMEEIHKRTMQVYSKQKYILLQVYCFCFY